MPMGTVSQKHPLFVEHKPDWDQLRDTHKGERAVKGRSVLYLPATPGMLLDGMEPTQDGYVAYGAYRTRAVVPELVRDAVEAMLGVMHFKPPVIELPDALESMRDLATLRNESLVALLRRINEEQLILGRLGMMLETIEGRPKSPRSRVPYVALYQGEDVINWDPGDRDDPELQSLNMVVLNETAPRRDGFEWRDFESYRVLVLGDPMDNEPAGEGVYRAGVFDEETQYSESGLIVPSLSGTSMKRIPFVFCNTKDVTPEPDGGPLLGLSNLTLTIYRGEADYRQSLFNQGQDTFVTIGATSDDKVRLGAGAHVEIANPEGDAKYVGVDSAGLSEQREALVNDYARGEEKAKGLIESVSRSAESGEALRVRVSARTASLNQIALTGAFALQELLKMAAEWVGANPDEVSVEPNLDFVGDVLKGKELVDVMTAKGLGAPISLESVHELAQDRGLTAQTWEDEIERMKREAEEGLPGALEIGVQDDQGVTPSGSPIDPEADPDDPNPDDPDEPDPDVDPDEE